MKTKANQIENDELETLYAYLELDSITDGRLKLKAKIMKKTVFLISQWKEGIENEWIDKIANRTNVSTRKIREDYIQPLITEGILERVGHGQIRFIGSPNGVSIPEESFTEHVKNNPHENPEPQPKQKQQQQKKVQ